MQCGEVYAGPVIAAFETCSARDGCSAKGISVYRSRLQNHLRSYTCGEDENLSGGAAMGAGRADPCN